MGHPVEQRSLDRIAAVAHETHVDVAVELLDVAGKAVLAVTVPAVAPRVVTTPDGRLLRRLGAANVPLRGDGVRRFLVQRAGREEAPAA